MPSDTYPKLVWLGITAIRSKATERRFGKEFHSPILDLARHTFEQAHELYSDGGLSFAESELHEWLLLNQPVGNSLKSLTAADTGKDDPAPKFQGAKVRPILDWHLWRISIP